MENYEDEHESPRGVADDLYIFGFSRGAFIACSLVSLIDRCGLLRKDKPRQIIKVFHENQDPGTLRDCPDLAKLRKEFSREVKVKLLALWDTVGALGVPKLKLPFLEDYRRHHAEELPEIVEHARHALALDEKRKLFAPTLWPRQQPATVKTIEQRRFIGSHMNVGGGYDSDGLPLRPLQWILNAASDLNLQFGTPMPLLDGMFDESRVQKSLDEALFGFYRVLQGFKEYIRTPSFRDGTNQSIDYTALERWICVDPDTYDLLSLHSVLEGAKRDLSKPHRMTDEEILAHLAPGWTCKERGFVPPAP